MDRSPGSEHGIQSCFFGDREKLLLLARLIPYCENNYNLNELGPKGTGKSHIFSEFSPHGILISGGEVTLAKLFVNNSTGKLGLVGYRDTINFDEFPGKQKRVDKSLVDVMKNYLDNKTFSRGMETQSAGASFAFVIPDGPRRPTFPVVWKRFSAAEWGGDYPERILPVGHVGIAAPPCRSNKNHYSSGFFRPRTSGSALELLYIGIDLCGGTMGERRKRADKEPNATWKCRVTGTTPLSTAWNRYGETA